MCRGLGAVEEFAYHISSSQILLWISQETDTGIKLEYRGLKVNGHSRVTPSSNVWGPGL